MNKIRLALIGLLLGALTIAVIWLGVRASQQSSRIATLEAQLQSARAQTVPTTAAAPPVVERTAPEPRHEEPRAAAPPPAAPNPELGQLRAQLMEAHASVARLQARVEELDRKALEGLADRARLSSTELTSRNQIDELTRKLDTMAAERPAQEKRVRELEADNERLREQAAAAVHRGGQVGKLANEWQDLAQRQQVYLTNAMRRFRELTDLLRRMPGNLDMKGNGPELTRVQSVISMADEDLRQLNDLATRLGRVQKQLAAVK